MVAQFDDPRHLMLNAGWMCFSGFTPRSGSVCGPALKTKDRVIGVDEMCHNDAVGGEFRAAQYFLSMGSEPVLKRNELFEERRNVPLDRIPDDLVVNNIIAVSDDVAKTNDRVCIVDSREQRFI